LEITEEEKEQFKAKFAQALKRAKDVEVQRRASVEEVDQIVQGADLRAQQHEEEQLPESD